MSRYQPNPDWACPSCSGTGERYDLGTWCQWCGGTGIYTETRP